MTGRIVHANAYDPLAVDVPASSRPAPVILFSHGLGGSRTGSSFLGKHWAARGYVAVFLQHLGSDDSVWKVDVSHDRMKSLKQAASMENLLLRVQDVPAVLNQLKVWNETKTNLLAEAIGGSNVLMTKWRLTDANLLDKATCTWDKRSTRFLSRAEFLF